MRTKASIKGHSIHPILVSFPVALFTFTLLSDISAFLLSNPFFSEMAYFLCLSGILTASFAAIPGLIDYFFSVPRKSSAFNRATQHALINITVLMLFSTVLFLKNINYPHSYVFFGLEGIGFGLLSVSGWLGGTLVGRNQIGIDHRYANAGKWSEEYIEADELGKIELENVESLGINQMKLIHVGDLRIVIARCTSGLQAFEDHCTHRGGSLADGALICDTVQCPWHGSQFNIKTGEQTAGPAKEKIKIYRIEEKNGKYFLKIKV